MDVIVLRSTAQAHITAIRLLAATMALLLFSFTRTVVCSELRTPSYSILWSPKRFGNYISCVQCSLPELALTCENLHMK